MGQSTSSPVGPDLGRSSSATRTGHHRTRHHHEHRQSTVSSFKNEHSGSHPRVPRTRTPTHHDQAERARRDRGHRDQRLDPLTEVDGNVQHASASAPSKEQERRKSHAKPKTPNPRNDGSAPNPHRDPNHKAEPTRQERSNGIGKSRKHTHSTPSAPAKQGRDSKDKSGVNVHVAEMKPQKPRRNSKPKPQDKKDCMVCVETRSIDRFPRRPPTSQCTHEVNTCCHCLRGWIRSEFKSRVWNQLDCPECRARMEYEDVKEFAPAEVFRRYDRLSTKAALESIPDFRWCIVRKCRSGQVHDEGDTTPRFRCVGCRKSHCVVHQIPWHKGETCAQYDYRTNNKIKEAEESASRKLIRELAKKCPGCRWNIEKNDGCDHMTCSQCSHQFCWLCMAPWAPIRNQGAQMHRPTCGLYSDGTGGAVDFI